MLWTISYGPYHIRRIIIILLCMWTDMALNVQNINSFLNFEHRIFFMVSRSA